MLDQPAPDFELPATGGTNFRLADARGRALVLYFYPKDNTPGCTTEGQNFRDLHEEFAKLDCDVYGISRDSLKSHESFRKKMSFPFHLLSDTEENACKLFDVIKMKNMYGKKVRGIQRSTFLVDAEGKLVREWRGVKAAGHAQEVLQAVKDL